MGGGCPDPPFSNRQLPDEFLERSRLLWDKAIEKAKLDEPIVLTNVLMGAMSVDFTMFQRVKDLVANDIQLRSVDSLGRAGREKVRDMARRIRTLMETYPGIRLTESNDVDPVLKREILEASRIDVSKESELVWMASGRYKGFKENPAINALYFDQMEIVRCE